MESKFGGPRISGYRSATAPSMAEPGGAAGKHQAAGDRMEGKCAGHVVSGAVMRDQGAPHSAHISTIDSVQSARIASGNELLKSTSKAGIPRRLPRPSLQARPCTGAESFKLRHMLEAAPCNMEGEALHRSWPGHGAAECAPARLRERVERYSAAATALVCNATG